MVLCFTQYSTADTAPVLQSVHFLLIIPDSPKKLGRCVEQIQLHVIICYSFLAYTQLTTSQVGTRVGNGWQNHDWVWRKNPHKVQDDTSHAGAKKLFYEDCNTLWSIYSNQVHVNYWAEFCVLLLPGSCINFSPENLLSESTKLWIWAYFLFGK